MTPQYQTAENFILEKLKSELSPQLTYHGIHHTLDVLSAAMNIGEHEEITKEEMQLLRVAVCFHDSGFLFTYRGHEERGCELVRQYLPDMGFDEEQMNLICGMIMATKLPQQPKTQLERIIADADLDYLGRDDFYPIGKTLFKEFLDQGIAIDEKHWNEIQVKFLRSHSYWTEFCKKNRDGEKQKRLKEIEETIDAE